MKLRVFFKKAICCRQNSKIYFNACNNFSDKSQQSCKQNILVCPFELESFHSRSEFMTQLVDFKITLFQSFTRIHQTRRIQNIHSGDQFKKYHVISVEGFTSFVWIEGRYRIKKVYGFKSIRGLRAYGIFGKRYMVSFRHRYNVTQYVKISRAVYFPESPLYFPLVIGKLQMNYCYVHVYQEERSNLERHGNWQIIYSENPHIKTYGLRTSWQKFTT